MRKVVGILTLFAAVLVAQDTPAKAAPEQEKFYRLDFQVQELEGGKVVNTRSYYIMVSTGDRTSSQMRAGGKVPYSTAAGSSGYLDVGVNVDVRALREHGSDVSLTVNADISTLVPAPEGSSNSTPTIRQNRWNSNVIVPLRKPTVIFSSDDPASKRKVQLELTATAIL